ncbi:hypothetical protein [Candidatus Bandiella euplotis]|uniref:Uncharacterized protein n=1 Tax=Candidatus Bandiella euplotis TaxID=1664265 RepID=A0ABZ0UJL5_9RICK|nr:hypothetical protein [Candidatus Bandiella woodruffii]WPX96293.1 hypothetical protein Bandiella_00402 [Candidatus Bandiella woodruffii]
MKLRSIENSQDSLKKRKGQKSAEENLSTNVKLLDIGDVSIGINTVNQRPGIELYVIEEEGSGDVSNEHELVNNQNGGVLP